MTDTESTTPEAPPPWFQQDDFWLDFGPVIFDLDHYRGASAEVSQLMALAGIDGGRALDLCCGPGRHALEFARRGFAVTGVDITAGYVERARAAALAEGLEAADFVLSDVRDYRPQTGYDLVINMYTSFGYFQQLDDDRAVLDLAFRALRPGGTLVIETLGKESSALRFRARHWFRPPGAAGDILLVENRVMGAWERVQLHWTLVPHEGPRRSAVLDIRLFSAVEIASLMRDAGFSRVDVYGDLDGGPYNETASILVAVGRK